MAYLTEDEFRARCTMPEEHIDDVLDRSPAFLSVNLEALSQKIDARLRKRYAVPFASPVPETIKDWLVRILVPSIYLKRGIDPTDAEYQEYVKDRDTAWEELKEAANGNEGLWDLPLKGGEDGSAITKSGCKAYSEQSVYVGPYSRSITAMDEDYNGSGTFYE